MSKQTTTIMIAPIGGGASCVGFAFAGPVAPSCALSNGCALR